MSCLFGVHGPLFQLPSIIFGLLRGDLIDSVEALVGWKDDRERDLILLRQINFSRCVDAFRRSGCLIHDGLNKNWLLFLVI